MSLAETLGVPPWLAAAASFTIVYGSVRALWRDDLRRRLACSSVSLVSHITRGAALAHPAAAVGRSCT